jgi:hypothetical protein
MSGNNGYFAIASWPSPSWLAHVPIGPDIYRNDEAARSHRELESHGLGIKASPLSLSKIFSSSLPADFNPNSILLHNLVNNGMSFSSGDLLQSLVFAHPPVAEDGGASRDRGGDRAGGRPMDVDT